MGSARLAGLTETRGIMTIRNIAVIGSGISDDGRYLLIQVSHGSAPKKTELYLKDLRDDGAIKTVVNDIEARSNIDIAGDNVIIQTNWNAPNERVMIASAADPARPNWRELVPENKSAAIQGVSPPQRAA